jgi:hypothetical protein
MLSWQGLVGTTRGLFFRFQGHQQPSVGLGSYLPCLALTNRPGLECKYGYGKTGINMLSRRPWGCQMGMMPQSRPQLATTMRLRVKNTVGTCGLRMTVDRRGLNCSGVVRADEHTVCAGLELGSLVFRPVPLGAIVLEFGRPSGLDKGVKRGLGAW